MKKKFNICVLRVYDYKTSQVLGGGMERWCRDIALLARDNGFDVTIYQKDSISFERIIADGVKLVGVDCGPRWINHLDFSKWIEKNTDVTDPFLFVSMELALSNKIKRSVGIQHGIFWEGDFAIHKKIINRYLQYQLIKRLKGIICVDTNYINWCHAEYPNRAYWQNKLCYLPNYADPDFFRPLPVPEVKNNMPTILFPRRVFGSATSKPSERLERDSRGAGFLLNAVKELDKQGIKVQVIFAGRGRLQEDIKKWSSKNAMKDRISVTDVSLDQMPKIYSKANITVIPSLEREGTSLSAIESIMCGIPTVVSHIGGLGNIVIDGVNGFICDLTIPSLVKKIKLALNAKRLPVENTLSLFRTNFGKPRWERDVWLKLSEWLNL